MSTILTPNFPDLNNLAIMAKNYFVDPYNMTPPKSQLIFNVSDMTGGTETVSELAGYGEPDETGESVDWPEGSMTEMYDKTFTPLMYSKKLVVSYKQRVDDPKAVMNFQTLAKSHGSAMLFKHETLSAEILNDGFSTVGPDGQYLFDTDHPTSPDISTTRSNLITTRLDAGGVAISEMLELFADNGVDGAGHPIDVMNWNLVVPTALLENANLSVVKLYGTSASNSNPSPLQAGALSNDRPINVIEWKYLNGAHGGSDVKFYLIATPSEFGLTHSLQFKWRLRPTTQDEKVGPYVDNDNGDYVVPALARLVAGAQNWRHCIGSNGTT